MRAAPLAALLAFASPSHALDTRLSLVPDPEPGAFRGLTLSAGPGRPVCGRATFDRRKAEGGGRVFVTDAGEPGDEDAIRLSEAVVARRGGLTSRAAVAARRHSVPAVALGRGLLDDSPAIVLEEAVFKPVSASVRAAAGTRERRLSEDGAVCVDAAAGLVALPPPEEADARVAAAEAARAYDGLRDAAALERWLEDGSGSGSARAAALLRELSARAIEAGAPAADLERLARAAGRGGAVRAGARRGWGRALTAARAELVSCAQAAADAPSAEVLDRLSARARETAARAAAAARVLGTDAGDLPALARACESSAAKRRPKVPAKAPSLDAAAAAAGASRPEAAELGPEAWRRFVEENDLAEFLARTLGDASLDLRRKSERIRERILGGRLDDRGEAGRLVLAAAPQGPVVVIGPDATLKAADSRALLDAARAAWASSWGPGPLGARLRAGRGGDFDGRLLLARRSKADVSGLMFSRDPSSGRRGRVLVEAAPGADEDLLDGAASADRWALDAGTGRTLEFVPAADDGGPRLSPGRLKKLARLARALDAWSGGAVEVGFSFEGDRLLVRHARTLTTR